MLLLLALAQVAQALTISPLNGTPDASPHTQISFLGENPSQIAGVSVVGSQSGRHSGRLEGYVSAQGASFVPAQPFVQGEQVTVSALVGPPTHKRRVGTAFTVAREAYYPLPPMSLPPKAKPGTVQSFASDPNLQPPTVQVKVASQASEPGDVFLAPDTGAGQWGPMIINDSGQLVWFQQAPGGSEAMDFSEQQYEGRPVLVWWQGYVSGLGVGFGADQIYNSNYQRVAAISGGNGYRADLHEVKLTPQGSAYITAYTFVRTDLSSAGGSTDGALLDSIVQEVDVKTGLVMFEWHALGHVPLSDSYTTVYERNYPWDFFHTNSISLDPSGDSNFIISSRNTWAAYEINHHTGAIEWRIGGKHSSFRMGAGTGIAWQHDVQWQPDGTLTVFDNGSVPKEHAYSRAIRLQVNLGQRAVTLVGRAVHAPPLLSGSQGDEQVLPNGDLFVGWGEQPYLTEFGSSGQMLFDATLPWPGQTYRAFREPWSGTPLTAPSLAAHAAEGGAVTLYASWNGATGVQSWRAFAGPSPSELSQVGTFPSSGFETAMSVHSGGPYFDVQALGSAGQVLGSSKAVQP